MQIELLVLDSNTWNYLELFVWAILNLLTEYKND